ncbi:hypothetical protein BH10BAC2_BH10BAC2_31420 [soil metagenome]
MLELHSPFLIQATVKLLSFVVSLPAGFGTTLNEPASH